MKYGPLHRILSLIILLFLGYCNAVFAQIKQFSVFEGLNQSQVSDVIQDADGSIWVSSDFGGISRIDGNKIYSLSALNPAIPSNVSHIKSIGSNLIFVSREKIYYTTKEGVIDTVLNLESRINEIAINEIGQIIGTTIKGRIFLVQDSKILFDTLIQEANGVREIIAGRDSKFIYGKDNGEIKRSLYKGGSTFDVEDLYLHHLGVVKVFQDSKGIIWFTDVQGSVYKVEAGKALEIDGLPGRLRITSFFEDKDGTMWVSTLRGIYTYDGNKFVKKVIGSGLSYFLINKIFQDREGIFWFATFGNGLIKYYGDHIIEFGRESGLGSLNITGVLPVSIDTLLISTFNGLFWKLSDGEIRKIPLPENLSDFQSISSVSLGNGNSVIVNRNGIAYLYSRRQLRQLNLPFSPIFPRVMIKSDEKVFIGTFDGLGIYDLNKDSFEFLEYLNGNKVGYIQNIIPIRGSKALISSESGLILYEGNNYSPLHLDVLAASDVILAGVADKQGSVWLSIHNKGIVELDEKFNLISSYFNNSFLSGKIVNTMVALADGSLLLGMNTGFELVRKSVDLTTEGVLQKITPSYLSSIRTEVRRVQPITINDGRVVFSTNRGLMIINPLLDLNPTLYDKIELAGMEVGGNPYALSGSTNTLPIPSNSKNISFKVYYPSHYYPELVQYSFRLDGFNDSWTPFSSNPEINYSQLPAGNYSLSVRLINGSLNEKIYENLVSIRIQPKWYFAWYAWIIYLGILLLSIKLFVNIKLRKKERRNQELEKLLDEKTAQLQSLNRDLEEKILDRTRVLAVANKSLNDEIKRRRKFQKDFDLIADNSSDIFCLHDSNFNLLYITPSVTKILQYQSDQLIGTNFIRLIVGEAEKKEVKKFIDEGRNFLEVQTTICSKEGRNLTFETIIKAIQNPNGDLEGYISSSRDISEKSYLRETLKQINKNLHRDFHDQIGNKLAKASSLVNVLKLMSSQNAGQPSEYILLEVEQTIKQLFTDTKDFVWSLDSDNHKLCELVFYIKDFGEKLFENTPVKFSTDINNIEDIPLSPATSRNIILIFKETFTNCLKYAKANEGHFSLIKTENEFCFSFKDDGLGFDIDSTFARSNGLKNLKHRAEKIGARLDLSSKIGKGTTVSLWLTFVNHKTERKLQENEFIKL
jgi:PAS domain S-box-containing protein